MLALKQIRNKSPCREGWTQLLKSLGNPPMDTVISLGDVAKSNGAADAWWCVRALDWSDVTQRRQVIAALIPCLERAAKHTTDNRVHDCIGALKDWIDGKPVDLKAAAEDAAIAAWAAAWAAEDAAIAAGAAWAAARAAEAAGAAAGAAWAAARAARAAEINAQRAVLIAAFPPLILKD